MRWLLMLAGIACATQPAAQTDERPLIRIVGSEAVNEGLMARLTAAHEEISGVLRFGISPGDSAEGFRALLDGRADIASASRLPIPAEQEQADVYGWTFQQHLIGLNVVTVQVHPSNPLRSLSYEQVRDIFCGHQITDWAQLGQEARPMRVLVRDKRSGTRAAFEDFFCGPDGLHAHLEPADTATIAAAVASDPDAIAFLPATERAGKILALRAHADGDEMSPTQANVLRGRYPLTYDAALYTAGDASPEVAAFIGWVVSPLGQQVIEESDLVPLHLRPDHLEGPRPLRETVTFDDRGTAPDERSLARLAVLEQELRERAGEINHVILEGYADASEKDPVGLSRSRAEAVRDHLTAKVPALFFEIIPRGAARPAGPEDTPLGRAANRRVQIFFAEEEAPVQAENGADGDSGAG